MVNGYGIPPRIFTRSGIWQVEVWLSGRRQKKSLFTKDRSEAEAQLTKVAALKRQRDLKERGQFLYDKNAEGTHIPKIVAQKMLDSAKGRAKEKDMAFSLSRKEFDALIARCAGHCEVTGLPFSFDYWGRGKKRPYIPTLDRIDPSKGYSMENCRIVCLAVNIALNEWTEDVFATIAEAFCVKNKLPKCDVTSQVTL